MLKWCLNSKPPESQLLNSAEHTNYDTQPAEVCSLCSIILYCYSCCFHRLYRTLLKENIRECRELAVWIALDDLQIYTIPFEALCLYAFTME